MISGSELGVLVDAIGVAVERRKLLVAIAGLAASWLPALFFFNLANQPRGGGLLAALLGLIVLWVGLSITGGVIARISQEQFVTGQPGSWREALRFVTSHIDGFLFGPLVAVLGLLALLVVEIVAMFLGRIPYLGELLASLPFFPFVLINLVAAVAAVFGGWLLFPIVAAEGLSATQAPARVVALVLANPVRVTVFGLIAGTLMFVTASLLFFLLLFSTLVAASVFGIGLDRRNWPRSLDSAHGCRR